LYDDDKPEPDIDFTEDTIGVGLPEKSTLKPREVVAELDRFIVGQEQAKRAVAIALRNRWRRHRLSENLREEVKPKNILMIGPTGCGKTEVARRLAKLANAPFIKVEATKFTEVGFHGRDVDSMIKDLVRTSISLTRQLKRLELKKQIEEAVDNRILDALIGKSSDSYPQKSMRDNWLQSIKRGELEKQSIDIEIPLTQSELNNSGGGGTGSGFFVHNASPLIIAARKEEKI